MEQAMMFDNFNEEEEEEAPKFNLHNRRGKFHSKMQKKRKKGKAMNKRKKAASKKISY